MQPDALAADHMKVMHVITGLGSGGAEAMLYKIVGATGGDGVSHRVVSLTDEGVFGPRLVANGTPVTSLGMRPGAPDPGALVRLIRLVRSDRPDVIQGWMYHANLLAGMAAIGTRIPVVWGIHHTDVDPRHAKRLTRWVRSLSARLSGLLAARIVCCAESARQSHVELGYRADRMVVIPNGFAVDRYVPDLEARRRIRRELNIPDGAPVVGLVARVHPDKDHRTFLAAAALVARERQDAVFLLAGDGTAPEVPELTAAIDESSTRSSLRLLGPRSDVPALLASIDVLASSSRSEGFPQILGEAMLCGVPCASTDVGDSREIIGPTGRTAPARDPAALARAILDLLARSAGERSALGAAARQRIVERYDIREVARRYLEIYRAVAR